MQIGHLNHLNYPKGSNPLLNVTADGDGSSEAVADGSAKPGLGATVRQLTPAADAPGVVLKLQSDGSGPPGLALGKGLVYSDGRKAASGSDAPSDTDSDTARMAAQHSQALQRSAGTTTTLKVDKDGVLVAGAAPTADAKPADFVSFAVSAMRDYADEQERLKSEAKTADSTSAASIIPRSLAEVQKLASRFKLFA